VRSSSAATGRFRESEKGSKVSRTNLGRRVKPSGGFELAWWYWMRISGLALVLLALGHLFVVHILFNVETINYAFVADRWAKPGSGFFWRLWDLAMVVLAITHGLNGLREILDEYIIQPGRRVAVHTLIWVLATVLVAMGSYAILEFQPDRQYIQQHPRIAEPPTVTAAVVAGERAPQ
jgi:succinate dehydrogenase / fumarate reductase membrane anchor subunit